MICSKKEKDTFFVKNGKRRGSEIFERLAEKDIYLTIKIITDVTSILCAEEE